MRKILFILALSGVRAGAQSTEDAPAWESDIAPILRSYCAGCHSGAEPEGDFSLETFAALRKGGDKGDPLKPGHSDDSLIVKLIEGRGNPQMPPKDEPPVPPEDLATLKRWIAAGAPAPSLDASILKSLVVPQIGAAGEQFQPATAAAVSPDGKLRAVAQAGRITITGREGRTLQTLTNLPGKVNALHFSPDSRLLVAATGIAGLSGIALLWDAESGTLVREFGDHRDLLYDAEISPDGTLLATAGYDRVIRLRSVANGGQTAAIDVHKAAIFDLAWHPSGQILASASADETVKLWRVPDGTRLDTLNQPQGEQWSVVFTADGNHIISAGADKRLHLWQLVSRDAPALNPVIHSRFAHEAPVTAITLTADGSRLISAADDRSLKLWSLPDLIELESWPKQSDIVSSLCPIPGTETLLISRMDGTVETISVPNPVAPAVGIVPPAAPALTDTAAEPAPMAETEPNDGPGSAMPVPFPALIKGGVSAPRDADLFRFHAAAGHELTLEVNAARSKSKLDSRIEILSPDGKPLEQAVLQATRDSWLTFRGKDSATSEDFRVHNWAEMELNEYLYCNGEVVKLWQYPRGPDSGFRVYPGRGSRRTYFSTTAHAHALGQPCYTVTALPAGAQPVPNGLPVFRLNWENDDDPDRRAGSDSVLFFTAPADGDYLARVTDVRGFSGADYSYTLAIRPRRPDFSVSIDGLNPKVSPGSGREFTVNVQRMEEFDGPVRIDIAGLPPGFSAGTPVIVEPGQTQAVGMLYAAPDAPDPDETADKAVKLTATAQTRGSEVTKAAGTLGDIQTGPAAKVTLEILPSGVQAVNTPAPGEPLKLSIRPGETITARVRAARHDFAGRIELGGDDCGRNLPFGVYIDNIGLNGLLIIEGETERDFQITASKAAAPATRYFHLRTTADGVQCSKPVLIEVRDR